MLSYEDALAKLLGWIGESVSVIVVPDFPDAMQVAGMSGVLRRGAAPPRVAEITGQAGEFLFFYVGNEDDSQRYWFVITQANFVRAFLYPGVIAEEMLVISQRNVNLSIEPNQEGRA